MPSAAPSRVLSEAALNASTARADLEDALTGRYLGLMSSNPAALARAIKFFGGLFDQAKTNPDRKPAIALARRLTSSRPSRRPCRHGKIQR